MINLCDINFFFGQRDVLKNANLLIRDNDKIGLVGPNGAGKSTLFNLIVGDIEQNSGKIVTSKKNLVIGYFRQDYALIKDITALDEVLSGAGRVYELSSILERLEQRMCDMENPITDKEMEEYGEAQTEFLHLDGYNAEQNAKEILAGLGISEERQREKVENFSGGFKMRIQLAKILLLKPDLLLLDEPTNHLDLESILYLESYLQAYEGSLLMTCHDRDFMMKICNLTAELSNGTLTSYTGDYDFYLKERQLRREQLVATYNRQQAMLAKEEEFIAKFAARASHANLVQSRIKNIEKIERVELVKEEKPIKVEFRDCTRSGDLVAVLEDLSVSYGDFNVFSNATVTLRRLEKVALTGVNGAGKSTLMKVINSTIKDYKGKCEIGASVSMGYFSQYSSDLLNPNYTVYEQVSSQLSHLTQGEVMSVLGAFRFVADDSEKKISVLSGGEKARVVLATIFARPINFLVLDEPTNHLDITTREVLLEALNRFEGTLLIVSHDRFFLKNLVTKVWELDKGKLNVYEGDYSYYLEKSPHLKQLHLAY